MTTQTNAAQTPAAQAKVKAEPSTKNTASSEVNQLVRKGLVALREFNRFDQKQIDRIVKKASVAALNQHGPLAMAAIDETGRGVFEDKAVKNIFACEHVTHSMAEMRSEEHTSELQSRGHLVCRLLPEKKKRRNRDTAHALC